MMGKKNHESCKPLFVKLKIMPLPCMYIYSLLVHVKENLMHYHLRGDMHQYQTRSKDTLDTPYVRLSKSINL